MALVMRARAPQEGEDEDFVRFEALFSTELDELREIAGDRDVSLEAVSDAYFEIVRGPRPMVTHTGLQEALGWAGPETWNTASVLVDFGEVYRSKGEDWWWIVASEFLAERCEKRSISLQKYIDMEPDLQPFQDDCVVWYQRRQMHGNLQERTMREIKVTHGQRLQEQYYPEKPLDPADFHDHPVSRYIKTAQDVIVAALDLSY